MPHRRKPYGRDQDKINFWRGIRGLQNHLKIHHGITFRMEHAEEPDYIKQCLETVTQYRFLLLTPGIGATSLQALCDFAGVPMRKNLAKPIEVSIRAAIKLLEKHGYKVTKC